MTDKTATLLSPPSENLTGAEAPELTEAFAERLFGSYLACLEVLSLQIGNELGLYRTLDASGWSTPAELAAAAGIHARYAREWLEQQAVAGMLEADDPAAGPDQRRYRVPPAHRPVLLEEDSPAYQAAGAVITPVLAGMLPQLGDAFRTGGGVAFAAYGDRFARAVAQLNAPTYRTELGSGWLPSIPVVDAALRRPGARVLDLGCGQGVSSVEIARAYPATRVVGVDLDAASVEAARSAAATAGVADRVTFQAGDAAGLAESGTEPYDLVTILEALHDLGDPVGALRAARGLLRDGGRVLVAENRVAESFAAPGDELDRFCYGASLLHCLPATMAQSSVSASGAVVRPATVAQWAREAGFARVEQLPIESPLWRLYLMVP